MDQPVLRHTIEFTVAGIVSWVIIVAHYEIRVLGGFPCGAQAELDHLTATPQPVQTVLSGMLNQSTLKDLLTRLELLGADVIEVRQLRSSRPSGSSRRASPPRAG